MYVSFFTRVIKALGRVVAIPLSILNFALSSLVAFFLYLFNRRRTETARRHVGTLAAGVVGFLIAALALLSNFESPSLLPGSGDLMLRGIYVALAGQAAMYGLSAMASVPGWLKWQRRRSSVDTGDTSRLRMLLNGARIGFSALAWGCYSTAQILDKMEGGRHAGIISLLFLCSPFYWFAVDLFQTWHGTNQDSRSNVRPALLLEGLVGVGVAVFLVAGAGLMIFAEGAAITGPVILAAVAGAFQALKIVPQKKLSGAGVSDTAALAGFASGSLLINLMGLGVLASIGVSVNLMPIGPVLLSYAIIGSGRQRLEQFSFSTPRRTAGTALMLLTAPLTLYCLMGALLGEWGSTLKVLGGILMLVAGLAFVALDELLLLTN